MKFSTKISYSGWIRNLVFLAVIVLFAFDVRTFLGNVLPISVITSGVFLILTACFYFLFLFPYRDQIAKVNIGNLDILMYVFMFWYGMRMVYNIYLEQIEQTTFANRSTYIMVYYIFCILPYLLCRWINWRLGLNSKRCFGHFFPFWSRFIGFFEGRDSLVMSGENAFEGRF